MNDPLQLDIAPEDYLRLGIAAPPPKESEFDRYHRMHCVCPKCGGKEIESTTIGYVIHDADTGRDENPAFCRCGWKGIVHDLLPSVFP